MVQGYPLVVESTGPGTLLASKNKWLDISLVRSTYDAEGTPRVSGHDMFPVVTHLRSEDLHERPALVRREHPAVPATVPGPRRPPRARWNSERESFRKSEIFVES